MVSMSAWKFWMVNCPKIRRRVSMLLNVLPPLVLSPLGTSSPQLGGCLTSLVNKSFLRINSILTIQCSAPVRRMSTPSLTYSSLEMTKIRQLSSEPALKPRTRPRTLNERDWWLHNHHFNKKKPCILELKFTFWFELS